MAPDLPPAGEQLSIVQKQKALLENVQGAVNTMNRKQRKAFEYGLRHEKDVKLRLSTAFECAIKAGWKGSIMLPGAK